METVASALVATVRRCKTIQALLVSSMLLAEHCDSFQSALTLAGHDPDIQPPIAGNCTTGRCVVSVSPGVTRGVSSIVLLANGICFTVMTILFVWLGSAADYGSFGRHLLLVLTVLCWIAQSGFMFVKGAAEWKTAMCLYIISYISYGGTLVFYAAVFPRLARNVLHVRRARDVDLKEERITHEEYDTIESLERNHISNISTTHSNAGYLLTLGLSMSVLLPLRGQDYAKNWALFLTNTYFVILGMWWFIFQQKRPGPSLPKGSSYWTIGWKQASHALRQVRHLPQTFTYLVAFFLLADGLNTTGTLVSIIQNDRIKFDFLQLSLLGMTQAVCSIFSTLAFWYIQQYFSLSTKSMFMVTNIVSIIIPFYGMLGLWTHAAGFHELRDFWLYNIVFGLFQAPYYAYSQTMMSELTPRGYENLFFGLFGITNRASSIIGPNVVQAIVNSSGNNQLGFPFLFSICLIASLVIWFVNVAKGREDCRRFVEEQRGRQRTDHSTWWCIRVAS